MSTVLLTGASGFLGVHTARQLLESGHHVRAFVRSPERLAQHLEPLGIEPEDARVEVAAGDMTDAHAVEEALDGCDALIHAAATFSFKRRDREAMRLHNSQGTQTVLEAGIRAGCRSLVHVSSTVALARPGAEVVDNHGPLGPGMGPYSESKVASERVARDLQDKDAPVAIVNPGGILGPDDPYLGESNAVVLRILRGRLPAWPRGSHQYVDVRDTAAVLVGALDHPGGRFLVPGTNVANLPEALRRLTGRRLPAVTIPAALAAAAAMPGYLTGWEFMPGEVEGARTGAAGNRFDATATTAALGIEGRFLDESLRDTIRWMVDAGHLPAQAAGRALEAA
jgi:nucleoside-diphosphate-sugar epimerase